MMDGGPDAHLRHRADNLRQPPCVLCFRWLMWFVASGATGYGTCAALGRPQAAAMRGLILSSGLK